MSTEVLPVFDTGVIEMDVKPTGDVHLTLLIKAYKYKYQIAKLKDELKEKQDKVYNGPRDTPFNEN